MVPYYEHNGITIYHGDCRDFDFSKREKINLTIMDPPYGMEYQSNYRRVKHKKIKNDAAFPVKELVKCINLTSHATYCFLRWDNLSEIPTPRSVIAWVKNNWSAGDLKHAHGRQWEAICFYPGPKHEFVKRIPDVIHENRTQNTNHPTEKPISLLEHIIGANVGNLVFDPFMGIGSTLRAAKNLGREAIGIELEEKYCEIAANRMRQETLSL